MQNVNERDYLVLLFKQKENLRNIIKSFKTTKNIRDVKDENIYFLRRAAESLSSLRHQIKNIESRDVLKAKAEWLSCYFPFCEEGWYESPDGSIRKDYSDEECNNYKSKRCRQYPIFSDKIYSDYNCVLYTSEKYWLDEAKEVLKSRKLNKMHKKLEWIRIGGDFYSNEDFFAFKGQAFRRAEWAIKDGNLINLRKVMIVPTNIRSYRIEGNYSNKFYLANEEGEKFVEESEAKVTDRFISIRCYSEFYLDGLIPMNLRQSMIKVKNQRIYSQTYKTIYYSKEMCKDICVDITEQHKKMVKDIVNDYFSKVKNTDITKQAIESRISQYLKFFVRYEGPETKQSIKGCIFSELFPDRYMTLEEMSYKFNILRDILKKEEEYASK